MDFNLAGVSAFALVASLLMLGVVLRARLGFIQKLLIPASMIGGVIGFAMMSSGVTFGYEPSDFAVFAFHFFTVSFMSLCLTSADKEIHEAEHTPFFGGSMWMAVVWVTSLAMQALIGLVVVLALNGVSLSEISPYLGIIVTTGFTQGPGQALAIGSLWESGFAIQDAIQIGVIFASVGFLATFAVGVPVARFILHGGDKGIDRDVLTGILSPEHRKEATRHVTHPSNVETLAYHIGLLGVTYLLSYQYILFMRDLTADITVGGTSVSVFFMDSLLFVHGLVIALIIRKIIDIFGWGKHLDAPTQKMVTGTCVDFMIIATLMSIQFAILENYLLMIILVSLAVTIATLFLCFGFTDKHDENGLKRSLTVFGCCCGSAGTGLLLLRLVDPHFDSPVAKELAIYNILLMVLAAPMTLVMMPTLPAFGLPIMVVVFAGFMVLGSIYLVFARQYRRKRITKT